MFLKSFFALYVNAYQQLKNDGKFLTVYGEFLAEDSIDCSQASLILSDAIKLHLTARGVTTLGNAYWKLHNYSAAIEKFTWLSNFLPNRFKPLSALLNLYKESGDVNNAYKTANIIVRKPIKIGSGEVDLIRQESIDFIHSYKP